jgi:hypothetical protein
VALVHKSAQLGLLAGTRRDIYNRSDFELCSFAVSPRSGVAPFTFKFVDEKSSIAEIF